MYHLVSDLPATHLVNDRDDMARSHLLSGASVCEDVGVPRASCFCLRNIRNRVRGDVRPSSVGGAAWSFAVGLVGALWANIGEAALDGLLGTLRAVEPIRRTLDGLDVVNGAIPGVDTAPGAPPTTPCWSLFFCKCCMKRLRGDVSGASAGSIARGGTSSTVTQPDLVVQVVRLHSQLWWYK